MKKFLLQNNNDWVTRLLLAIAFLLTSSIVPVAQANGWEHLAIPRANLMAALESGDFHTMEHAVISIGVRREARDVEPLLVALDRATDHHLRLEIYRALGLIGDDAGVPALLNAMQSEARPELRASAAISLGAIGATEALPALLAALNIEEREVRLRIIDALGAYPVSQSIEQLAKLSRQNEDEGARLGALRALGATGSLDAVESLLTALKKTTDRQTLAVIIDALANIAAPQAAEPLRKLLESTDDPVLEVKLVVALGAIGGKGMLPTLTDLLWSDNRSVQLIAARLLTDAKSPETAPELARLYRSLADRRSPQATEHVKDAAAYLTDLDLMKQTIRALLETDPVVGLDSFLDAAQRRDFDRKSATGVKLASKVYELRRISVYSLGYTRSTKATKFLKPIAQGEEDPRLRSVAIRSLGVLGDAESYTFAVNALTDSNAEVRSTAAIVLGRLGNSEAVPKLMQAVSDPHEFVRMQSANSLGLLGDKRARESLEQLAEMDESEKVRESARQALLLMQSG